MAENETGFCGSQSFKVSMKEDVHIYPRMFRVREPKVEVCMCRKGTQGKVL